MSNHDCLHEEQLIGQSRAIERLSAELNFKKERLDELKDSNKRMEDKIDKLNSNFDKFMRESDAFDGELDNRITALETEQNNIKETMKNNKADTDARATRIISIVAVCLTAFGLLLKFI